MKRIPSKIESLRITAVRIPAGGFRGWLSRHDGMWIWSCDHHHRTESGARGCVRTELKRWVA